MPLIKINGLRKSFQGTEIIKGLDLELENGKCTALLGPNGSGKTTTLRMLSGLMKPSAGTIEFDEAGKGQDIRSIIGFLPQFPVFYDWMTGFEFMVFVGKLGGLKHKEANDRALEQLCLVGLESAKNRKIGKFSGGMKQRLGIAQALIHRPRLVMLDEPVSALDPIGRREILELMDSLKKETTILFSTHILNDAEEVCDKALFLHNGSIVESGSLEELRDRYQQSQINLLFHGKADSYAAVLKDFQWVQKAEVEGSRIQVNVHNLEQARQELLKIITDNHWPLLKFEISSLTLEDLFMMVVGK